MPKKEEPEGAPAYMALYTSLMTIMLAFFILLNTLSQVQEAGFKAGIGKVQNAFGWKGGLGIFKYAFFSRGADNAPGTQDEGQKGVDDKSIRGEGGAGQTDEMLEDAQTGEYQKLKVPYDFESKSSLLTPEMREYFHNVGAGFNMFGYKIKIKNYSEDFRDYYKDADLALKRALAIKNYLKTNCRIPENKLEAEGYASPRYIAKEKEDAGPENNWGYPGRQGTYFFIFRKFENPT